MDTDPLVCDRFRVGKLLGRGGMGAVYEAHDGRLMREVAIKRILALEFSAEDRERISREARTVAALSSPHIVQVFDLVGDERELCIVMERMHGKPLSAHLTETGLTDVLLFELLAQALVGIADAHAAGVIHRDIKPENIFVVNRTPPLAKVLDFGIAKSMDHSTTLNGVLAGTPAYMSPEQVKCLPLTPRVDLFAIGVILYRHFTKRYPFGERTGAGYLADVCAGNYHPIESLRPDLPPQVARLVNRALAPDARDRTESARVLREEILACLADVDAATVRMPSDSLMADGRLSATFIAGPPSASVGTMPLGSAQDKRRRITPMVALAGVVAIGTAVMALGVARSNAEATPGTRDQGRTTLPVVVVPSPLQTAHSDAKEAPVVASAPLPSARAPATTAIVREVLPTASAHVTRSPTLTTATSKSDDDNPPRL